MNIHCYFLAFNESDTIHLTLQHYQKICTEITVFDNHSTDETPVIAKAMGAKVKTFGKKGELSDRAYLEVKNECWKKEPNRDRRNYVIVCDADEILSGYPPDNTYSTWNTIGRDVFSYYMPKNDWFEIDNSHYQANYSKNVIFDPKRITDTNYRIGAHVWSPRGDISVSPDKLFLFHFRNVGGPERLIERHRIYRERMSEENKIKGFGVHYTWDDEARKKEWLEKYSISKPLGIF